MPEPADIFPDVVLLDGALVPTQEATVSVLDRGLLYGESLFETVKVVDGCPCLWQEHEARLAAGCAELGLPLDLPGVRAGIRGLLAARPLRRGALRLQVTGGVQPGGGRGMTAPVEGRRPRIVATVQAVAPHPDEHYQIGVAAVTVRGLSRSLPWLKSGNYLASVAAKGRAEAAGAFEALFVAGDPPCLLEGSFTNLMMWDGRRLVAPPPGHALPGVTAAAVFAEAAALGREVVTAPVEVSAARRAALLLTGSLLGVCPCARLDGSALVSCAELAGSLRTALEQREAASRRAWTAAGPSPAAPA